MDYEKWLKKHKKILSLVLTIIVLVTTVLFILLKPSIDESDKLYLLEDSIEQSNSQQKNDMTDMSDELYADVKGAVEKPGIYQIDGGMRVWDVVQLAGGIQEKAETKNINFAEKVSDQMVIYIPFEGEVIAEADFGQSQETTKEKNQQPNKVNLNQANEMELQTLAGIGQKKAQEIIAYREENGGFKDIEELKKISGIGDKTFEKIKELICVK